MNFNSSNSYGNYESCVSFIFTTEWLYRYQILIHLWNNIWFVITNVFESFYTLIGIIWCGKSLSIFRSYESNAISNWALKYIAESIEFSWLTTHLNDSIILTWISISFKRKTITIILRILNVNLTCYLDGICATVTESHNT